MFENGRVGVYVVLDGDGRLLAKGEAVITGDRVRCIPSTAFAVGLPIRLEVAFPPCGGVPDVWVGLPMAGGPISAGATLEIPPIGRDDYAATIHFENGCRIKLSPQ